MENSLVQLGLTPIGASFFPPSEGYICGLEELIGAALPAAYRTFLARFGACTFANAVASCLPDSSWIDVHIFLGSDPDDSLDLVQSYLELRESRGDGLLPVATCPLGNPFCLAHGGHGGEVRYVEMGSDSAARVADTFGAFIAGLRRMP